MELVSFGDHLKRYIYERAGLEEPYNEVTQDIYRDIVVESFHETCTPKSMNPTSTKLTSLANNWLTQASVKRETVFLLGIRAADERGRCVGFSDPCTEGTGF